MSALRVALVSLLLTACHGKSPSTGPVANAGGESPAAAPSSEAMWAMLSSSMIALPAGNGDFMCEGDDDKATLGAMAQKQLALFNSDAPDAGEAATTCKPLAGGRWSCATVIHYKPVPHPPAANPCGGDEDPCAGDDTFFQIAFELDAQGEIDPITLACSAAG